MVFLGVKKIWLAVLPGAQRMDLKERPSARKTAGHGREESGGEEARSLVEYCSLQGSQSISITNRRPPEPDNSAPKTEMFAKMVISGITLQRRMPITFHLNGARLSEHIRLIFLHKKYMHEQTDDWIPILSKNTCTT